MTQWQEFLIAQGANFEDGYVADFGTPNAINSDTILADLSHLGLLRLQGDDAVTFLQGQVTNDVKKLDGNNSHYSGYCTPKGRLLALFLAFAQTDGIYLQFPRELIESIQKRLKMYVMRSKVTITDVSDEQIHFGIAGNNAAQILSILFGSDIPQQAYATITIDNTTIIRMAGELPRYQLLTSDAHASKLWATLSEQTVKVGKPQWDYLEIQAGIPEITLATQEAFVPQMVNLDALDGINFKKGCYTGQEIVARTHYLGKVKRRTQLAHIDSSEQPKAGDDVCNEASEVVGKIVRSAPANTGFSLLIEIRLEATTHARWKNIPIAIASLPYALGE